MKTLALRLMLVWFVIAFLLFMLLTIVQFKYTYLYIYTWLILIGLPFWFNRRRLHRTLQDWQAPDWLTFLLLGYGMVLLEENFAALYNHLSEGFRLALFIQRIGQFWAFNVFAFSGLIIGWLILQKLFAFSYREVFFLTGLFGLYSERVIYTITTNLPAFVIFAPLIIFIYGLIITPATLSMKHRGQRYLPAIVKYPLALIVIFLVSIPFLIVLLKLRALAPYAFPPHTFIP